MRVDLRWPHRQVDVFYGALRAVGRTMETLEGAETYLRPRRRGGATNAQIRRKLATSGPDPMAVPDEERREAVAAVRRRISEGLRRAHRSGVVTNLRDVTVVVMRDLARWLRRRIAGGGLGRNTPATRARKARAVARGTATSMYGIPPPKGVHTGEFLASIATRRIRR